MIRQCPSCGQKNRIPAAHLADTGNCGSCKASIPPVGEPIEATAETFDEIVSRATVPVLVDFWAAWCGPCRMVAPEVRKTAELMAGHAVVLKVDTEKWPALARRFQVMSIPNLVILKDGEVIRQQPGAVGHQTMVDWLRAVPA
jgi:thioredoxin 2